MLTVVQGLRIKASPEKQLLPYIVKYKSIRYQFYFQCTFSEEKGVKMRNQNRDFPHFSQNDGCWQQTHPHAGKKTGSNYYFLMFSQNAKKKHDVRVDKYQFPLESFILFLIKFFFLAVMAVNYLLAGPTEPQAGVSCARARSLHASLLLSKSHRPQGGQNTVSAKLSRAKENPRAI